MKKSFIVTLGLAAFAVGAFAGVKSNVKEVKAESIPEKLYFQWTGCEWEKWGALTSDMYAYFYGSEGGTGESWHGDKATDVVEENEITYVVFDVPAASTTVVFNFVHEGWNEADWAHQTNDLEIPTDGKNLFTLGTVRDESTGWKYNGAWSTFGGEKNTVTLYGIFDNELREEALNSFQLDNGSMLDTPDAIIVTGYHFGGWYLDEGLTQEYVPAALEADLVLYAKYTTFKTYLGGVVYITEARDIFTHVYFFGEFEPAPWPGLRLEDLVEDDVVTEKGYAQEISNNGLLHFNGLSQKMFLIPAPSTTDANYKMILNNGSNEQTVDMDVVDYAGLYVYRDAPEGKWDYSMNTDAGLAAVFVAGIDNNRNNVKANEEEGIKAYSICGLEKSYAATMVDVYDNQLTDEARKMVNDSTTYTYNKDGSEGESDISFADIVAQLRINASKDAVASSNRSVDPAATSMGVLIAAAACVTLLGACIIIRKKVRA